MTKILTGLSIVLLLISGWFIYSQGLVGQLLNPTVRVLTLTQDMTEGQQVSLENIDVTSISVADIPVGATTFSSEATSEDVAGYLGGKRLLTDVATGAVLSSANFGPPARVFQIRSTDEILAGEVIDPRAFSPFESARPQSGTFTFTSQEEAQRFIDEQGDSLRAARNISLGQSLGVRDFSQGSAEPAFVLKTVQSLVEDTPLSPADVRSEAVSVPSLPRGAITFASQSEANIFVTSSPEITLAVDVPEGEVLQANMVRFGAGRVLRDFSLDETPRPETFPELVELQTQAPLDVKFVNLAVNFPDLDVQAYVPLIGAAPMEGDRMDMWVETNRTTGDFGTITLRRFVTDIEINKVVDPQLVLAERQRREEVAQVETSGATPPPDPNDVLTAAQRGVFYWAAVSRKGGLAIEEANEDGRVVFMLSSRTPVSDFLGNGVICREDMCSVSISVTRDLEAVRADLAAIQGQEPEPEVEEDLPDPFVILDGVSLDLQEDMHAAGYLKFQDVASWSDDVLDQIGLQLNITRPLAVYIREQASVIVNMPTKVQADLAIGTPPTQGDVLENTPVSETISSQ